MSNEPEQDQVIQEEQETPVEGKKGKEKKKKTVGQEILSWVITLVSAVVLALIIRTFLFEPIRVDGSSMFSTLKDTELMLVTKLDFLIAGVQRGDVIICKFPDPASRRALEATGESYNLNDAALQQSKGLFGIMGPTNYVKRLVGVPGDTIRLENGVLYVNGEAQAEEYLDQYQEKDGVYYFNGEKVDDPRALLAAEHSFMNQYSNYSRYMTSSFPEITLGENEYFVMGDNRGNSRDSRYYGTITREMIVGHVKCVFWPLGNIRGIQ